MEAASRNLAPRRPRCPGCHLGFHGLEARWPPLYAAFLRNGRTRGVPEPPTWQHATAQSHVSPRDLRLRADTAGAVYSGLSALSAYRAERCFVLCDREGQKHYVKRTSHQKFSGKQNHVNPSMCPKSQQRDTMSSLCPGAVQRRPGLPTRMALLPPQPLWLFLPRSTGLL